VRSFGISSAAPSEKQFRFNVFLNQKWTPYLMMVTLFNTVSGVNEFMDEAILPADGKVEMGWPAEPLPDHHASLGRYADPAPIALAGWWGRQVNSPVPQLRQDTQTEERQRGPWDLLPERRVGSIENAWVSSS